MPRKNITLNDHILKTLDNQAEKENRTRSGHLAELIKEEDKRQKRQNK